MYFVISLSVALLLLSGFSEQSVYKGTCSNYEFTAVKSFYPSTLKGKWWLIATDDDTLPYNEFDCIRFKHLLGGTLKVLTNETAQMLSTKTISTSTSRMNFSGFNGNYVYETGTIRDNTTIIFAGPMAYVEVTCKNVGVEASIYVGIFYRAAQMPTSTRDNIYAFLENKKINTTKLRLVEQDDSVCGPF